MKVYEAEWILPVTTKPIKNGAVVIKNGKIFDFGKSQEIKSKYNAELVSFKNSIIIPGLVNTHSHIELSALKGKIDRQTNFVEWLKSVVIKRQELLEEEITSCIKKAIEEISLSGTIAIGDVTNYGLSLNYLLEKKLWGTGFIEVIGFKNDIADEIFENVKKLKDKFNKNDKLNIVITPHATYSVSEKLFQKINKLKQKVKSVHLSESIEEIEFLKSGGGRIFDFLKWRGAYDEKWILPKKSPVKYLNGINFLDKNTIAVHCTNIDDEDIEVLKNNEVNICTCPGSNEKLGVGTAPVEKFLRAGINVAIGTDSLASNDDLNLFNEMKFFKKTHPAINDEIILKIATINGAKALKLNDKIGSIEKDKFAELICLEFEKPIKNGFEFLERQEFKVNKIS
jgi:cytosine/adenosine deaminase-related metal-dependent hydrolase